MGHFSHNCKLTGLPITGGPAVLIVMKPQQSLWDNSEEKLKQYGKSYMCSNDGPRLKYIPCWFPIKGEYDTYGRLENIIKDDNTAILEEYYGMSIEELLEIVCSGRKDDGYDGALDRLKKPIVYPEDWVKGEKHFDRYQRITGDKQPFDGHYPDSHGKKLRIYRDGKMVDGTKEEYDADFKLIHEQYARYQEWKKTDIDVEDDYGKPQYDEKYKELLSLSGMWIHGDLYDQLTSERVVDEWKDSLDLGTPALLNSLGFVEGKTTKRERYNRPFTKDGLTLYSDGTWIDCGRNESVYRLKDLKKYCKKKGVEIDITEHDGKDRIEQIYDYIIPTFDVPRPPGKATQEQVNAIRERFKKLKEDGDPMAGLLEFSEDTDDEIIELLESIGSRDDNSHLSLQIKHYFLNTDRFGSGRITNPLTIVYLNKAKEGKLRDNLVRFWRFDGYMFACGKYYEIVGTGPQDGDHKQVLKVLTTAVDVLTKEIKERYEDEEDDNDDDE